MVLSHDLGNSGFKTASHNAKAKVILLYLLALLILTVAFFLTTYYVPGSVVSV